MIAITTLCAAGAIVAPHVIPLERASPADAIAVWVSALAIRALVSLTAASLVMLTAAHSALVNEVGDWCLDEVVPLVAIRVTLDAHHVGDAATLLPTIVVGASLIAVAWGAFRAIRAIGKLVARSSVGPGPAGSVIVGGREVMLATVGLARPRVLVSTGALLTLEDDELQAGLAHEQGHIARRHRYLMLFAELCRGVARFLPGTRRGCVELRHHLERDADGWALAHRHRPHALMGAIAKSRRSVSPHARVAPVNRASVARRLAHLGEQPALGPLAIRAFAAVMVAVALALAVWAPAAAAAGMAELVRDHPGVHCGDTAH